MRSLIFWKFIFSLPDSVRLCVYILNSTQIFQLFVKFWCNLKCNFLKHMKCAISCIYYILKNGINMLSITLARKSEYEEMFFENKNSWNFLRVVFVYEKDFFLYLKYKYLFWFLFEKLHFGTYKIRFWIVHD